MYVCIYTHKHTHTHTYIYIYIYITTVIFIIAKPEKEALAREAFKDTAINVTT